MKRYEGYVAWQGAWLRELPSHWMQGAIRNFADFRTGWTPPTDDDAAYRGPNPWANISDLGAPWLADTAKSLSDETVRGQVPAKVGDLLFSFKLSVGTVSRVAKPMFTNEAIATFSEGANLTMNYAYYALPVFVPRNANTNIYGAPLLNSSLIRSAPFAAPPVAEQIAIADYLDRETAKIDALIEKQRNLVVLVQERDSALIRRHIYGEHRPLGAKLTPIRRGFAVTLGKMLDAGRDRRTGDMELPYLRAANIQDDGLRLGDVNRMPFSPTEASVLDLRRADLLVVEGGAGVGTCQVLQEDMPGWSFQKTVNRVRSRGDDSTDFLALAIRVCRDSGVLDVVGNKSTIPHLTVEKLLALEVPMPSVSEQRRVVGILKDSTFKAARLTDNASRLIELAQARRSALITAAVTGQIDVRPAA